MSDSLDIRFLDSHTLGDPLALEGVVRVFLDAGFSIKEFKIDNESVAWEREAKGMRNLLRLAHEAKDCYFLAWNPEWRLEIRQYLAWGPSKMGGEKRAWIVTTTDNTPYFWDAQHDPASYSRFYLDIGKYLYEVLQPSFGWIDFDYGLQTTHEDIEAVELPTLYWANFLSPRYVNKIGKCKIRHAPAWTIEELSDGGLLYVLASSPGLAEDHVPIERVKAHFGVDRRVR